jgi:hypothetical protein
MSQSLVKGKNIDVTKVAVSQAKVLDNGAKLVYVNYSGSRFNIQTPWMELPWGMSCFSEGAYPKYSCEMSFKGMDENPELQAFHDRLLEVEDRLIDIGVDNGTSWFKLPKNKCSKDIMGSKFTPPIVKVSKDKDTGEPNGKYAPTFKLKIPCKNNVWETKLYDMEGNPFNVSGANPEKSMDDVLVKGAKVKCIMSCVGIWVAAANYMCQWKMVKATVDVPESSGGEDFLPDSDDEDVDTGGDTGSTEPTMLDDTDEDDESGSAATPKKIVKKKKLVKN